MSNPHVCLDPELTPEQRMLARQLAIQENPANALAQSIVRGDFDQPQKLALFIDYKWKVGRTITCSHVGDSIDPYVIERVEHYAHQLEEYANIKFQFIGSWKDADIRIGYDMGGSWSYLGTVALAIPKDKQTMNYGWLTRSTPENEYSRVVLHEFAHALGCVHEHVAGGVQWNKPAVYDYYHRTQGWNKQQVDNNIFNRYSVDQLKASEYDPLSITHYPVPKELTLDGVEVGYNRVLSDMDKEYLQVLYPFDDEPQIELVSIEGVSVPDDQTKIYIYSSWNYAFSTEIQDGQTVISSSPEVQDGRAVVGSSMTPIKFEKLSRILLAFFDNNGPQSAMQPLGTYYVHESQQGDEITLDLYGEDSQYRIKLMVI